MSDSGYSVLGVKGGTLQKYSLYFSSDHITFLWKVRFFPPLSAWSATSISWILTAFFFDSSLSVHGGVTHPGPWTLTFQQLLSKYGRHFSRAHKGIIHAAVCIFLTQQIWSYFEKVIVDSLHNQIRGLFLYIVICVLFMCIYRHKYAVLNPHICIIHMHMTSE